MTSLVERLRAKVRRFPPQGGGGVSAGPARTTATSYVTDDGMRLANPDGPAAADRIEALERALERCRDQFDFYVSSHMAKTPPDMEKAATNQEFVELCDAALSGGE